MSFHAKGSCNDLITEISFPEFIIFYDMGVSVAYWEIDVEVFDLFGYLPLQTPFLLFDLDDILVSVPVSFDSFQGLLEKERQVLSLLHTHR